MAAGISGVTVHIYPGEWDDLHGAIRWAKQRFKHVIAVQTYGKDFPIEHRRPSFQLDQALRAGVRDWENVRLKLGAHNEIKKDGSIFFADTSQSSPFGAIDDLRDSVRRRFGKDRSVVFGSAIQFGTLPDILNQMRRSSAVISIDSGPLHASSGSATSTCALATDQPTSWHGSAWHPRFAFYCRYGDYEARKDELLWTLEKVLQGKEAQPKVKLISTTHPNAYNPSIIEWKGRIIRAYRFNPKPDEWPTSIAIEGKPIVFPQSLNQCSIEDSRFFLHNGKLHISYVWVPYPLSNPANPPCSVGYSELAEDGGVFRLVKHTVVKYGKNDLTGQEKNWVFFESEGRLYCIYKCSPEQTVLEINGENVVREFRTKSPEFCKGDIRGGTQPIEHNGLWLRFFHTLAVNRKNALWWFYYTGALLMEKAPPFSITAVSKMPVASADERYFADCKFWKPRVLIPYGAVKDGNGWRVSVGVNDGACGELMVKPEHLNL